MRWWNHVRGYAVALAGLPLLAEPTDLRDVAGGWSVTLAVVLLTAGLLWLTPRGAARSAAALGGVSREAHGRLLRRQLHDRVVLTGARDLYRRTRDALAAGEADLSEAGRRRRLLDAAERSAAVAGGLATGGGSPPWRAGLDGAGYALLLTLPPIAVATAGSFQATDTSFFAGSLTLTDRVGLLALLVYWLRWGVYGLIFGYLYPRLRGRDAMSKALLFSLVVLVAETFAVVGGFGRLETPQQWEIAGGVVVPAVFLATGLGLLWERRLAARGGMPWRRIRRLSNVRSFTAPVVTIVVATASAGATLVVNAMLSAWINGK